MADGWTLSLLAPFLVLVTVGGELHDDQSRTYFADDRNVGGSFQHLVVDLRTGRLYVSATNRLYQLDAKLAVEAVVTTGPQADNPFCPPPPTADCHDARRVPTDAVSKALALDQRDEHLIACTNLFQGHCERRRLSNVTLVDRQIWSMVVPNDAHSPAVVFVAPGPPNPASTDVVYVAATRSTVGLPAYRDIVPAICARDRHDLTLVSDDILTPSRVDVEVQHRDTFRVDYVAGFASHGFSYFVALQRSSATADPSSSPQSYLARVCHADRSFASYVEVPLECRSERRVYRRVRAVQLTHPGSTLAGTLGFHSPTTTSTALQQILVAVFTSASTDDEVASSHGLRQSATPSSALCIYTMVDVVRTFTAAIQKCFRGIGNTGPDHLVQPKPCFVTAADQNALPEPFSGAVSAVTIIDSFIVQTSSADSATSTVDADSPLGRESVVQWPTGVSTELTRHDFDEIISFCCS